MTEPLDRFLLTGKVCVVTGGSRGLGYEMVKAFAAVGADVVIASRKLANCEEVAAEIERTTGRQAMPIGCHVGDWEQCDAMVDAVYERFGRIDVLVNNAGMSPLYESLAGHSEALYDKVFDVNLKGPFRLMANVGTRMAEGDGGSIINVSSGGATRPVPTIIPYSAAKAGLNAMTIGFSKAFGPNGARELHPGRPVPHRHQRGVGPRRRDGPHAARPMRLQRPGNPDEVIGAALYFASDASSWTTGAILQVDGGMP